MTEKIESEEQEIMDKYYKQLADKVATMKMTYEVHDDKIVITERKVMQDLSEKSFYAQRLSKEYNKVVVFEFNEIDFWVDQHSNIDLLREYYNVAHLFDWEIIGPLYNPISELMKKEIKKREADLELEDHLKKLKDFNDQELIRELFNRGYDVFKVNEQDKIK